LFSSSSSSSSSSSCAGDGIDSGDESADDGRGDKLGNGESRDNDPREGFKGSSLSNIDEVSKAFGVNGNRVNIRLLGVSIRSLLKAGIYHRDLFYQICSDFYDTAWY